MSELIKLIAACETCRLEGRHVLADYTLEKLAEIYNGIGPDRFPDWLRAILTDANGLLEPAALIHDVRYHVGGTKADFTMANEEFHRNCLKLIHARFAWYDPRRYKWQFRAWRYARYCENFGWEGFNKKEEEK